MYKYFMLFVLTAFLFGCYSQAQKGTLMRAYGNYEKGDYEDALSLLSQAESYQTPPPDMKAEMVFLKALSLEKLGRSDEAKGALQYLAEQHPDNEYGYRAKALLNK